jgi:broad specificity phosphatase PhoE
MASGAESDHDLDLRAQAALALVGRDFGGLNLGVVTHLGLLLALVENATGSPYGLFSGEALSEGSHITLTRSSKGAWKIRE